MTTYKELFGKYVQNYASDPTSTDAVGQIWYNTTSGTFRTALGNYGVWSSAAAYNTPRNASSLAGTQTAAVFFGGYTQPTPPQTVAQTYTENWNGTAWSNNPTGLNTARYAAFKFGTQTAALAAGGNLGDAGSSYSTAAVELYNGSSWTNGTSINTPRYVGGSAQAGPQTAGLIFGGFRINPGFTQMASSESWNGSSWTNTPSLNTGPAFSGGTGLGTQSAAMYAGREPTVTSVELWNGSSWTAGTALPIGRQTGGGAGTQTAALVFTGTLASGSPTSTIYYNGTAWTSVASVGTGRPDAINGGAGTASNALLTGSNASNLTEAWTTGDVVPVAGSWSSGGNLPTARNGISLVGPSTASFTFGGTDSGYITNGANYNGTSWTTVPATVNTARGSAGGTGTQASALFFGGIISPGALTTATESWNGSSWTSVNSMNTSRRNLGSAGIQTASLAYGGLKDDAGPPIYNASSESWNGTSWTSTPSMNTGRYGLAGSGLQTAALGFGGNTGSFSAATESWNGSSWTNVTSMNTAREQPGGAGIQTATIAMGGQSGSYPSPTATTSATELYNGTSWTTNATGLGTARITFGTGSQSAGLAAGGDTSGANVGKVANTEEWTGPYSTLNYKTLTTS
jgi:hypothetical protein